ncbi:MAG: ABC transporter substrate-binding protein [Aigarchaeota archaeon]|nr:ABC transporter substrate-binding protein [Candidatus Pelearchaeum maunauluense]
MIGNKKTALTRLEAVLAVLFIVALIAAGAGWVRPVEMGVTTVTKTVGEGQAATVTVTETQQITVTETVVKQPEAPRKIKIGLLTHQTGPEAPIGQDMERAFLLAVEEINTRGGVYVEEFGTKLLLEPVIEDQQSSREGTVAAAERLVNVDKVDIIVGGFGSAFIPGAQPIIAEAGTPYIITGVSTPIVVTRTDIDTSWFVLYQAIAPEHGQSISLILAEAVKPVVAPDRNLKVAVLYQDSPFGEGFFAGMKLIIEEKNLPIDLVFVDKFKVRETDFRALLTAAAAANPDVIVPIGFIGETIAVIQQGVRDLGIKKLYGPVCVCVESPTYYKDLGREGEFSLIQTYFGPYHVHPRVAEKVAEFSKKFEEKWGVRPGSQGLSVYDAVYIAVKAIEEAGTLDKAKVAEALRNLVMGELLLPVPGGVIKFKPTGHQTFELYGVQLIWDENVQELRPVIVWPKEIAEAEVRLPSGFQPGG